MRPAILLKAGVSGEDVYHLLTRINLHFFAIVVSFSGPMNCKRLFRHKGINLDTK